MSSSSYIKSVMNSIMGAKSAPLHAADVAAANTNLVEDPHAQVGKKHGRGGGHHRGGHRSRSRSRSQSQSLHSQEQLEDSSTMQQPNPNTPPQGPQQQMQPPTPSHRPPLAPAQAQPGGGGSGGMMPSQNQPIQKAAPNLPIVMTPTALNQMHSWSAAASPAAAAAAARPWPAPAAAGFAGQQYNTMGARALYAQSPSNAISGFQATVPQSPAHRASNTFLSAGSHQELYLPLSEAAPELFGGNPAASTPHYDPIGATGAAVAASAVAAAMPRPQQQQQQRTNISAPFVTPMVTPLGPAPTTRSSGTAGGFQASVPQSPAHRASNTFLASGSHQEMFLPLSEAAPELFGGNPAASTPHYDAVGAAASRAAPTTSSTITPAAAPVVRVPAVAATPYGATASSSIGYGATQQQQQRPPTMVTYSGTPVSQGTNVVMPPTTTKYYGRGTPAGGAAAAPPTATTSGGGFAATVPQTPAHRASTTMLTSGSHQEMVLPLSEAAPELFGRNPAASTPHYDALASVSAGATPVQPQQTMAYPQAISNTLQRTSYQQTATAAAAPTATFAQTQAYPASRYPQRPAAPPPQQFAQRQQPAAAAHGFTATVPQSPAHRGSSTVINTGSRQEMFLPLSEAAPELFGGNPAASTPHYDARP